MMLRTRLLVFTSSVAMAVTTLTAPMALATQVASITATVTGGQTPAVQLSSNVLTGQVGDTFVITNVSSSNVSVDDLSGLVVNSPVGYNCLGSCIIYASGQVGDSRAFTITAPGFIAVNSSGATAATLAVDTAAAQQPAQKFRLAYESNGGTCRKSHSDEIADTAWTTVPTAEDCWRDGFALAGWSTSKSDRPGLFFKPGGHVQVTGTNTLYAKWELTVTEHWDGKCSGTDSQVVGAGSRVTLPGVKTCGNQMLTGWRYTPAGGEPVVYQPGQSLAPSAGMDLWGVWTPFTKVTMKCSMVPGTPDVVSNVATKQSIALPTECGGKQVEKWALGSSSGRTFAAGTNYAVPYLTDAVTLIAQAPPRKVSITWVPGDKAATCTASQTTVLWGSDFTPTSCARKGYTLTGWTVDGVATSAGDPLRPAGDSVKAQPVWALNQSVAIGWGFGVKCTTASIAGTWDAALGAFRATLPTGDACSNGQYVLLGWNTVLDGSGSAAKPGESISLPVSATGTTTYFAQWGVPITFDYNLKNAGGASGICPTTTVVEPFGKAFVLPAASSCATDIGLIGNWAVTEKWQVGVDPRKQEPGATVFALMPTTFYAWWGLPVTVKFDANGGTCTTASRTLALFSEYSLPDGAQCTRAGYRLDGWGDQAATPRPYFDSGAKVLAFPSVTLYAQWVELSSHCDDPAGPEVDWRGCDKRGVDLTGVNMGAAKLVNTILDGATIAKSEWFYTPPGRIGGAGVLANNARMRGAVIKEMLLPNAQFMGADMSGVQMSSSTFGGLAVFHGTNLTHARLQDLNFTNAWGAFTSADLSWSTVSHVLFGPANAAKAKFAHATLSNVDFGDVGSVVGADFSDATLTDVTFTRMDVADVDFSRANLTRVHFVGCWVNGKAADVKKALKLDGATLTDVTFS